MRKLDVEEAIGPRITQLQHAADRAASSGAGLLDAQQVTKGSQSRFVRRRSNRNGNGLPIHSFVKSGCRGLRRKLLSAATTVLGTCSTAEDAAATHASPISLSLAGGGSACHFRGSSEISTRIIMDSSTFTSNRTYFSSNTDESRWTRISRAASEGDSAV